jgi:hypothetical protein
MKIGRYWQQKLRATWSAITGTDMTVQAGGRNKRSEPTVEKSKFVLEARE